MKKLKKTIFQRKLGVYLFKDAEGNILFVGKSQQLKRRLAHYFEFGQKPLLPRMSMSDIPYRPVSKNRPSVYNKGMAELKNKLRNLPHQPGVYLFKDKDGQVLYVGKAKDLRSRVFQYFGTHDNRPQLPFLMADAADLDYIVVSSELESLFLENTLIKQYLPQYNIKLRDDKNYAFIKIDYSTQIPTIGYARKIEDTQPSASREKGPSKTKYFGPYSSTRKIKSTLDFVRKVFPYCANDKIGKRPCFYYYLHRCPGVCVGAVTLSEYEQQMERIVLFLSGKTEQVKKELRTSMQAAALQKQFEVAAKLRDQLHNLEVLDEKQVTMFPARVQWDFVSVANEGTTACVNLFKVREGKLIDKENFVYESLELNRNSSGTEGKPPHDKGLAAILQKFLETYYAETSDLPRELFIQSKIPDQPLIEKLLHLRQDKRIPISMPSRGQKLKLVNLGITNGAEYLKKWLHNQATNLDAIKNALEQLKTILQLPSLPRRIEGYDISNTQGTHPVGSMVVAKDGLATKSEYRKFKISVKQTPDDFAMMEEMLTRRLAHIKDAAHLPEQQKTPTWPVPDLIVIDGGKGQLGVAVKILEEKNLAIPVIGLAKRIEEIFLPHNPEPIVLSHDNPALQLLQRLRDEAHRFGITFHRSLRSKAAVKSALDEIPGIGPKTKKILKATFGTIAAIRQTPFEELVRVVGPQKADIIKKYL